MMSFKVAQTRSCPACQSTLVDREPRNGLYLRIVCAFTKKRPYRCFDCDCFFLAPKRLRALSPPPSPPDSNAPTRARAAHG
jgi:hypothetical protein